MACSPALARVQQLLRHHSSQWLGDGRRPGWERMLKPFQKPLERKWVIFCFPEWFHWNLGKIIAVERSQFLLFCSFFSICFHTLPFEYTSSFSPPASPVLNLYPIPHHRNVQRQQKGKNKYNKQKIKIISNFLFQIQRKQGFINFQILMMAFRDQKSAEKYSKELWFNLYLVT